MPIPQQLQQDQVKKAVTALLKHISKQQAGSNDLLDSDEMLYLVRAWAAISH